MSDTQNDSQPAQEKPKVADDVRAKISEGMRKSHARRKAAKTRTRQQKTPASHKDLLGQLRAERDALDKVISVLEERGMK